MNEARPKGENVVLHDIAPDESCELSRETRLEHFKISILSKLFYEWSNCRNFFNSKVNYVGFFV